MPKGPTPRKSISITKTHRTEIEIDEDVLAEILRAHFKAPDDATLSFDITGYEETFKSATLSWSTTEHEEVAN